MEIRIGCSGFYNRHWKGIFYPEGVRQKDWFRYYATRFHTLELNTTFYKFPEPQKLRIWFDASPEAFQFSVKAPRLITHFKKLTECERLLDDFYNACVLGLEHKLGCLLFQFPPLFSYSEERLEMLCCSMRPGFRNVVEFRHESWWNEQALARLREKQIIFCTPSHPTMPDDLVLTSDIGYIRLHGKERLFYAPYSTAYMRKLIRSISKEKELKEVWIYFNNTASTAGILNAVELQELMSRKK